MTHVPEQVVPRARAPEPLSVDDLRQSEERFRLLTEGVRDYAIFMLDPDGHVASWNLGAEAIKQWTRDEILGQHFSRFYPPEDVAAGKCERILAEALRDGRFEDHGWRVRKDGTRFWANVIITPVRSADGALRGFAKVTRDLTQQRATEETLRQSEERFRLLVEAVGDYAIFMLDPEGRVRSWNTGAQRIKGYTANEIIGQHFSRFYPPEDVAAGKCELELAGALAQGRFEDEGWRVRKDGTRFWADVILTPMRSAEGTLLGFAKVTRDLTARKRDEELRIRLAEEQVARRDAEQSARERADLVEKLEAAVRARDDFLSVAAHELRTPLHILSLQVSSSRFLLDAGGASLDRLRGRLDKAQAEIARLDRLMDGLLDVSRIAANRLLLEPQELDLVGVVRDLLERDREEVTRAGCAVSFTAPAELQGHWDRLRLEQIVTNLLSNALRYGERKPVEVTLERAGDRARLTVTDQGRGIAAADHGRIFERFERAVSSRAVSGLGLGLWIVREVVDAMGGSIRVESQPGRGSSFVVELPIR